MSKYRIEDEFEEYDKSGSWAIVYNRIRNAAALDRDFEYSIAEARKPENRARNRYRDVNPYDHSRVKLRKGPDYINASLVEFPAANRSYILAQGPLLDTSGHFWQMAWEQNCKAIIMLNRTIEKGTIKCYQYWPMGAEQGGEDSMAFNDVGIKVSYKDEDHASYYTVRTLEMEHLESGEKREVYHFHYTTWPDFGVPQSPAAFLNFLVAVRQAGVLESSVGPPVVHCSAGIGRSGTLCLVDTCLVLIAKHRDPDVIDVRSVLLSMRKYRMGLIQTADQLRFSYLAIIEGAHKIMSNSLDVVRRENNNREPVRIEPSRHSSTEDEEPPPLPPRRKKHSPSPVTPNDVTLDEKNTEDISNTPGELRRRRISERKKKTAEIVKNMKQKQRDNNIARRSGGPWSLVRPACVGLALLAVGVSLYRYFWS